MASPSDTGYKQLFSYPELARELLRIAVPQGWTNDVRIRDFSRINASYVSANGKHRHDDVVWRVRRYRKPSIYMLVEFQSQPDVWMTTRMQSYVALLSEDLVKQRSTTHGKEPLLLPIVVYSGRKAWPYSTALGARRPDIPPGLEYIQPELNYVLVNRSIQPGVIRALLELERSDDEHTDVIAALRTLFEWVGRQNNDALARTMDSWVRIRLQSQFADANLAPELTMEGIAMMFEHDFRSFTELLEYRTLQRGRREGREEGRQEGRQEGLKVGQLEGAEKTILLERQNFLRLLLKHVGLQLSSSAGKTLDSASAAQMQSWIHMLLETGELPSELRGD